MRGAVRGSRRESPLTPWVNEKNPALHRVGKTSVSRRYFLQHPVELTWRTVQNVRFVQEFCTFLRFCEDCLIVIHEALGAVAGQGASR